MKVTHIERRRRRALLCISLHGNAVEIRPAKEQPLELNGVPVEVEVDRAVLGEERLERFVAERVRVRAGLGEDYEVCDDVHDTDTELGRVLAQQGGGRNGFEDN